MADKRSLVEQYVSLIEKYTPPQQAPGDIHRMDQNISILRQNAAELGLDLDDEDTLQKVILAHILTVGFTLGHIQVSCDNPTCAYSALKHVQVATGQLGAHFQELEKNLS